MNKQKLTDAEIIKVLECCITTETYGECDDCCPLRETNDCYSVLFKNSLELIKRLKKENDDLFYKLTGVMWFVDKWLDGKELKQDEVNRAATMREKTLQIIEKLQEKINN